MMPRSRDNLGLLKLFVTDHYDGAQFDYPNLISLIEIAVAAFLIVAVLGNHTHTHTHTHTHAYILTP